MTSGTLDSFLVDLLLGYALHTPVEFALPHAMRRLAAAFKALANGHRLKP
jgi:hypothetical protein